MADDHGREVERLLEAVRGWAARLQDVRAVALVGSRARGEAHAGSDVDLVILTEAVGSYVDGDEWVRELGAGRLIRTRSWGALTERRLAMPGGLEVDVGFAPLSWAYTDPIDPGTAGVAASGLRPLYDPDGLLAALL